MHLAYRPFQGTGLHNFASIAHQAPNSPRARIDKPFYPMILLERLILRAPRKHPAAQPYPHHCLTPISVNAALLCRATTICMAGPYIDPVRRGSLGHRVVLRDKSTYRTRSTHIRRAAPPAPTKLRLSRKGFINICFTATEALRSATSQRTHSTITPRPTPAALQLNQPNDAAARRRG